MSAPKLSWYLLCVVFLYIETQGALGQKQAITKPTSQGYGSDWCKNCGSNIVNASIPFSEVARCFLPYGVPGGSNDDTVFECACKPPFNGPNSNGINCFDVDECSANTDWCDNFATCDNTLGSFTCTCQPGFHSDDGGKSCLDINECVNGTNNCDTNASCTNTAGSFTCSCDRGFTGIGTFCEDIDECWDSLDSCDSNANCTNTIGSYSCSCQLGFSGDGFSCVDIDECLNATDICGPNAKCNNTYGAYSCDCITGFAWDGYNCTDINECSNGTDNGCDSNAFCVNYAGGHSCRCKPGFDGNGLNCSEIVTASIPTSTQTLRLQTVTPTTMKTTAAPFINDLYPYGRRQGDQVSVKKDDACNDVFNQNITMFGKRFSQLFVCTNGDIALGKKFVKYTPQAFPLPSKTALISPYWADADPRYGGDVYSRITRNRTLLQRISNEVRNAYRLDSNFNGKWMLIATWDNMIAFQHGKTASNKRNTFQGIVVSDDVSTFVLFIYDKIEWTYGTASDSIPAQVGFDAGNGINFYAIPQSRTPAVLKMPRLTNVGIPGRMMFKLSNEIYVSPSLGPGSNSSNSTANITGNANRTAIVLPDYVTTPVPVVTTPSRELLDCDTVNPSKFLVASSNTGRADLVLNMGGSSGFKYTISLPPGKYPINIKYNPTGTTCPVIVKVYTPTLRKRVDIKADYNVTCEAYRHSLTNNLLNTVAEQRYSVIEHICGGLCHKPSITTKPIFSCHNDILTVKWPTDVTVTGDSYRAPSQLISRVRQQLLMSTPLLDLLIITLKPPVVYPMRTRTGALAELILTPYCVSGRYDLNQDKCV